MFSVDDLSTTRTMGSRWLPATAAALFLLWLIAGCGSRTDSASPDEPPATVPAVSSEPDQAASDPIHNLTSPAEGTAPEPTPLPEYRLAPPLTAPLLTDPPTPSPAPEPLNPLRALPSMTAPPEMELPAAPQMSAARTPETVPQMAPQWSPEAYPAPPPEITVLESPERYSPPVAESSETVNRLPVGAEHMAAEGYTVIPVFYGTDRQRSPLPLSAYRLGGDPTAMAVIAAGLLVCLIVAGVFALRRRRLPALAGLFAALAWAAAAGLLVWQGRAVIEKDGVAYTGGRGELVRGRCLVTVPDTHQRGQIERPSWHRLEVTEDLRRHVVMLAARELPESEFHQQLADAVATAEHRDLFVFIHGYNVDFESAVRRTAQIAVDLPFRGVPVCYSWPSQGSLLGYTVDENNVTWTIAHLKQFLLELVAHSNAESINLVAHSMGNRALTAALREFSLEMGSAADMFDRVVLAAPDIDADHFRRDLAPHLLNAARHVTLYASSGDRALIASQQVHGYPRAGESGAGIVVMPGIETVDVSGIDLSLLGHSYYGESQHLLHDLFHIVRNALPAAQRSWLVRRELGPLEYWQLPGTAAAAPGTTLR